MDSSLYTTPSSVHIQIYIYLYLIDECNMDCVWDMFIFSNGESDGESLVVQKNIIILRWLAICSKQPKDEYLPIQGWEGTCGILTTKLVLEGSTMDIWEIYSPSTV